MTAGKVKQLAICVTIAILSCGCLGRKHTLMDIAPDEGMSETDSSFSDFWSSVITEQGGQTNAVYYAGTTNGSTILFHETSVGIRKWNLKNANIEKSITMPYTEDRSKWIVLKDSGEERFRHWDWRKEIEDFIQNQPRKSALVKPISTFYRVGGELSEDEGCIFLVDEFSVESTLCGVLKKGDKICTGQLYDGSKEAMRSIRREARHAGNRIVGRKSRQDAGLRFAYWDKGEVVRYNELPSESFFVIDNEIVAPFEFMWNNTYDGLLEFDEKFAQDAYIKRTLNTTINRSKNERDGDAPIVKK